MKQSVIRDLSTAELREKLSEETAMFSKLKMNHAVSPLENPMKIKGSRKTVARLKTELNKRESAEQAKKQ